MLDKTNTTRFHNDREQAQRTAREQLNFISANLNQLNKLRNGSKYIEIANSFNNNRAPFTDKQLSYIDVIYEKVMQAAGFESFSATYKPKRKFC